MIDNYPYTELEVVDYDRAIEIKQGDKNFVILTKYNLRKIYENCHTKITAKTDSGGVKK